METFFDLLTLFHFLLSFFLITFNEFFWPKTISLLYIFFLNKI